MRCLLDVQPSRHLHGALRCKDFLKRTAGVPVVVEFVERPLPKPSDEGYIEARLLEALGEAGLALGVSWREA
jgi:hypothetical protein